MIPKEMQAAKSKGPNHLTVIRSVPPKQRMISKPQKKNMKPSL